MESEQIAKKRKALNLCIFNIPESNSNNPDDCYRDDVEKFKEIIANKINLKKENVKAFFRIGKPNPLKIRPIILTASHKEYRDKLLQLRDLTYSPVQNNQKDDNDGDENKDDEIRVFISPDRTTKERDANKLLVAEWKERKRNGENVVIKNGKIVAKEPFRSNPQEFWGSE